MNMQTLDQMYELYKQAKASGQSPEQFWQAHLSGSSSMTGFIPKGLERRLYNDPAQGGYDYQQFGADPPAPIDPAITDQYVEDIQAAAQPYKPSTFDRIAQIGAVALPLAGMAVGKKNPDLARGLGFFGGMAGGYAGDAPNRFATNQNRKMLAAQGIYDAGVKDYGLGYDRWQDQQNVAGNVVGAALQTAGMNERQAARLGTDDGPALKETMEQLLTRAIRTGDFRELQEMSDYYKGKSRSDMLKQAYDDLRWIRLRSMNIGGMNIPGAVIGSGEGQGLTLDDIMGVGSVPSTADINRAEKDLQGLKDEQLRLIREGAMNAMGAADNEDKWNEFVTGWPIGKGNLAVPPNTPEALGALRDLATVGGWRKGLGWWGPDPYPNTAVTKPIDRLESLNALGLEDFIAQSGGKYTDQTRAQMGAREEALTKTGALKPPPNDGSMSDEEYRRFKVLWKTSPEIRRRWREANK